MFPRDHFCCEYHNSHSVSDVSFIQVIDGMATAAMQVACSAARGDNPDAPDAPDNDDITDECLTHDFCCE